MCSAVSLLGPLQQELRAVCVAAAPASFVRISRLHHALFTADLPRHTAVDAQERLRGLLCAQGFVCASDAERGLWHIDLSVQRYAALLVPLPVLCPSLPGQTALHPAYALCRLLLLHPAPFCRQPLAPLRQMLKLTSQNKPSRMLHPRHARTLQELHEQCAILLRQKETLPHAAGAVLAAWLREAEGEPEAYQ